MPVPSTYPFWAGTCYDTVYKIYYLKLFSKQIVLQSEGKSDIVELHLLCS